jgi:hypothetical protein
MSDVSIIYEDINEERDKIEKERKLKGRSWVCASLCGVLKQTKKE